MTRADLQVVEANAEQWAEFDLLATRSYGHPVGDVTALRSHADARVGLRGGKIVAGGLGLLLPQYFGGRPVLSACLAAGCVAPEERGDRLAQRVISKRVEAMAEQGAVISTVWTKAASYARHQGWEAVAPVFAWSVAADELARSFTDDGEIDVEPGLHPGVHELHSRAAELWDGPIARPDWWWAWTRDKHALTTYTFFGPERSPVGALSIATRRHERHGTVIRVHDFWATDTDSTWAMFAFLGRYRSRAETIEFRRGVMPPNPLLLQTLGRHQVTAEAWHPWMIRILDISAALQARGWPNDLDTTLILDVIDRTALPGSQDRRIALHLADGLARVDATTAPADITLTERHLAAWYAGSYRSPASARLAGIDAVSEKALSRFVRGTTDREPWLPDHF